MSLKQEWVNVLRTTKIKQARDGTLLTKMEGAVVSMCALGALQFCPSYHSGGWVKWEKYKRKIVYMNDEEGKTFAEIADYIEANF